MPRAPQPHQPHSQRSRERQHRQHERERGSAAARLYGRAWQRARKAYLQRHPLCVECLARNLTEAATVVDHIEPHRGDRALFWNEDNWQALCKHHHDRKTAGGG